MCRIKSAYKLLEVYMNSVFASQGDESMRNIFKSKKQENENFELDMDNIPNHIAIIMDGNGRWAK